MEIAARGFGVPGFINARLRAVTIIVITVMGMTGRVSAQDLAVPPPSEPAHFSQAELETLAEPIALYPDPLLEVMLPASVYPVEIVQAARFIQDANNLPHLDNQPWDENVIALAHYPTVIQKMNDNLEWTVLLGDAFAEQPAELMDAIQNLRLKAQAAGTLQNTPQQIIFVTNAVVERNFESQIVFVTNTVVEIQPADPQIIYVPIYNPTYVFHQSPGFVYTPRFSVGFRRVARPNRFNWWYGGMYVGGGGGGLVVWNGVGPWHPPFAPRPPGFRAPIYRSRPGSRSRPGNRPPPGWRSGPGMWSPGTAHWQPNPNRRRNSGMARDSRGWGPPPQVTRGHGNWNNRPNTIAPVNNAVSRSNPGRRGNRPGNRAAATPNNQFNNQPNAWENSAFGVGNGNDARNFSNRGSASRGGAGGRGGGGGRSGGGRRGG
jgi:hypothetical protein